jgi:hypothetical protein
MRATVPQAALPTQLDLDNRLTSTYTTHVLFPTPGPLAIQRYTRLYARVLRDYLGAVELVIAARAFAATHGKPVAIPKPPPRANKSDFKFSPVLAVGNEYRTNYMTGLRTFAFTSIDSSNERTTATETKAVASQTRKSIQFEAGAIWPKEVTALLQAEPELELASDGRLVIHSISPHQFVSIKPATRATIEDLAPGSIVSGALIQTEAITNAEGLAVAQILHGIAQPNLVIEDMLAAGLVQATGVWLGTALATTKNVEETLAKSLVNHIGQRQAGRDQELSALLDRAVDLLRASGLERSAFLELLRSNQLLREYVYAYTAWKVDQLGPALVPLPDDTTVLANREWGFRRTERLNIRVGTPTLRGPFHAEAVAPNSKLTVSESTLHEVVTFREQGSARSSTRTNEASTLTAGTFRQALSHMTEDGISNESAFSQDTTLFETLRERRREAIDRTVTQISSANEERSGMVGRTATSSARSYVTRGKDPHFATTEVAFQVAAPIDVEVLLEAVGFVWCPRIMAPFIYLHQVIADYERLARREYLEQNLVIDPVRPPELYETASFKREIAIDGDTSYQSKNFKFDIPAGYLSWELDVAATDVHFRNGTWGDYNWDEAGNLDDLENWEEWISSIARVGNAVEGTAVLETTDPEWLNRGFLTFDIVMRTLTEASRAALMAYELDREEAAAQRRAVLVRADQYARMRRDELIEHYSSSLDLQEEAFSHLIQQVFRGGNPDHVSYYKEVVRSCIGWSNAAMRFEPNTNTSSLPFPHLPPAHFMNALGIRFILPVLDTAEDAFFEAMETGAGTYYSESAARARQYVESYRERVEQLKADGSPELILDQYTSELVLGRHLEAVLSEHPFAEPS